MFTFYENLHHNIFKINMISIFFYNISRRWSKLFFFVIICSNEYELIFASKKFEIDNFRKCFELLSIICFIYFWRKFHDHSIFKINVISVFFYNISRRWSKLFFFVIVCSSVYELIFASRKLEIDDFRKCFELSSIICFIYLKISENNFIRLYKMINV